MFVRLYTGGRELVVEAGGAHCSGVWRLELAVVLISWSETAETALTTQAYNTDLLTLRSL